MAELTDQIKAFIVKELAMYQTPSEVAASVKEEFGLRIERQQVHLYNPEGSGAPKLAKRWKDLHAATRQAFLAESVSIPIAQKSYRLRALDRMARKAMQIGNSAGAAQLLEQAAKEVGDAYTNKRQVDHSSADGSMSPKPRVIKFVAPVVADDDDD